MKNVIKKQSKGGNRGQFIISIKDKYDNLNIYEDSIENLKFKPYEGCREIKEFNEQKIEIAEFLSIPGIVQSKDM